MRESHPLDSLVGKIREALLHQDRSMFSMLKKDKQHIETSRYGALWPHIQKLECEGLSYNIPLNMGCCFPEITLQI